MRSDEIEVLSDYDGMDIAIIVRIDHYRLVKGSYSYNAPSDMDYTGYEEIDYTVMKIEGTDEEGNPVELPEPILTEKDKDRIENAIRKHYED
jgi:hypothetical protein